LALEDRSANMLLL